MRLLRSSGYLGRPKRSTTLEKHRLLSKEDEPGDSSYEKQSMHCAICKNRLFQHERNQKVCDRCNLRLCKEHLTGASVGEYLKYQLNIFCANCEKPCLVFNPLTLEPHTKTAFVIETSRPTCRKRANIY